MPLVSIKTNIRECMRSLSSVSFILGSQIIPDDLKKYRNPFGIGHFINHPPKDIAPNVMSYFYDFHVDMYANRSVMIEIHDFIFFSGLKNINLTSPMFSLKMKAFSITSRKFTCA